MKHCAGVTLLVAACLWGSQSLAIPPTQNQQEFNGAGVADTPKNTKPYQNRSDDYGFPPEYNGEKATQETGSQPAASAKKHACSCSHRGGSGGWLATVLGLAFAGGAVAGFFGSKPKRQ